MPPSTRGWLGLPSQIAMLLGLGALSVTGAKAGLAGNAHAGQAGVPIPQQSAGASGDVLMWAEDGRIYISEGGKPAEELTLGNTAEAQTLRGLLERSGASAATPTLLPRRVMLAGAGGSGLHWESQRPGDPAKASAPASGSADKAAPQAAQNADRLGAAQPAGAGSSK